MKAETLADPAVEEFAGLVRRLNDVVGSLDTMAEVELLMAMDELLPLIYGAAHRLPDVYDDDDEDEFDFEPLSKRKIEEHTRRWRDLREKFGSKLGWHRILRLMYDPFPGAPHGDHEVMVFDLADILAEVCLDLAKGLELYELGDSMNVEQAIWDWKFGLKINWGRHAAEAMLPVHQLLHHHYDDYDAGFDI